MEPQDLIGRWRGSELSTGHPLDGLLAWLGWFGKEFRSFDDVHPLLFTRPSGLIVSVNPALMPVTVAMRWPRLARMRVVQIGFRRSIGLFATAHPTARLRRLDFRGRTSAAMIYDSQPIVDHYRRIDDDRVLGLMDRQAPSQPFFFLLERHPLAA